MTLEEMDRQLQWVNSRYVKAQKERELRSKKRIIKGILTILWEDVCPVIGWFAVTLGFFFAFG